MLTQRTLFFACRVAAFSLFLAVAASLAQAQSAAPASPNLRQPLFFAANADPFSSNLAAGSTSSSSSSSSDLATLPDTSALGPFDLAAKQPPPRRSYGRPNYSDKNTNSDGSPRWVFDIGGGFNLPTGGTHNYATTGWRFQGGGGRNFSKVIGVLLQFDYDHFGVQTATLNKQLAVYNTLCGGSCGFNGLNGNIHDWAFTLNPTFTIPTEGSLGAYVVTGVGFYHKYTQFTTPTVGEYCDPFYGCYEYQANQPVDWYTSNAAGVNGGLGVTWKFSKFSNEKFFAEAKYVYTANSRKRYDVSGATPYFNAFTPASAPTTYIPVTFGLRF